MSRLVPFWILTWVLALGSVSSFAHDAKNEVQSATQSAAKEACERYLSPVRPLTLRALREQVEARIQAVERITPKPGFDNIEIEAQHEQIAEREAPLALQQILGPQEGFVSTPAPTSPDPATVNLTDENSSFPVHVDLQWQGQRESTTAYVTLPGNKMASAGDYIIGAENPVVLVHLHGGGTPTATGKNAMSIGEKLAPKGIPTVALDLPGHGRATRKLKGLETMEGQVDWILKIIDQLVHPGVKVVLSGHSWGGEFATYMQRHSNEPKYARIAEFIALSPPVDVSLGGDLKKKLDFEEWWQKNFTQFEDKIAPADFEFQQNMLNNGKDSDVGAYFTAMSDFDYSTPPLTPEQQAGLKPLLAVASDADGVVYVGREKEFAAAFGGLVEPSKFILLGPGQTWKSKGPQDLQPTGHNIFDRYVDGTTTLQVYSLIADAVTAVAGKAAPSPVPADRISELMDGIFRHYANFLAFREMVQSDVEYVESNSADLPRLSKRKVELDDYIRRAERELREGEKQVESRVAAAIEVFRKKIGLTEAINLKRAQEELGAPPLTDERRQALLDYVAEVQKLDEGLRAGYQDPQYERDLQQLSKDFAPLLKTLGLKNIEGYKALFDAYQARKDLSPQEQRTRGDLSRLHQRFTEVSKHKQGRFGLERDRRLAGMARPDGVLDARAALRELNSDRSEERRAKLAAFVEGYPQVESQARMAAENDAMARAEAVAKPEGVTSLEDGRAQRDRQNEVMNMTYAPDDQAAADIAHRLAELGEERDRIVHGSKTEISLEKLDGMVDGMRKKRAALMKKWDGLWKQGDLSSAHLKAETADYDRTLESYKELYFNYESKKGDWLLQLKQSGQLTEGVILAGTPELKSLRHKVQHAKQMFYQMREQVEESKWIEALSGRLEGPENSVSDAVRIATEIWGVEFASTGKPSEKSLTARLRMDEDYLEGRRRQLSLLEHERDQLRFQYAQRLRELKLPAPYVVERVPIFPLLNRPLIELTGELRRNPAMVRALTQLKSKWEDMLAQLRRVNQTKGDAGGY